MFGSGLFSPIHGGRNRVDYVLPGLRFCGHDVLDQVLANLLTTFNCGVLDFAAEIHLDNTRIVFTVGLVNLLVLFR